MPIKIIYMISTESFAIKLKPMLTPMVQRSLVNEVIHRVFGGNGGSVQGYLHSLILKLADL